MSEYPYTAASVSCLCEKVSVQQIVVAPVDSPPPPRSPSVSLCHCSSCRSTSGVLCTSYYRLVLTPNSSARSLIYNPSLKEYVQSPQLSRWFCGTCGAHVLAHLKQENKYLVAAGVATPASSLSSSVAVHWGVGETRDGGISVFIPGSRDDRAACLLGSTTEITSPSSSSSVLLTSTPAPVETSVAQEERLRAQCHCGGVAFVITPPNNRSKEASSPWPDSIVPFHKASSENPEDVKWWLRANDTKYMAATCACRSCRLASGFPIQCWAFIPKVNLINDTNQADRNVTGFVTDGFSYGIGTMQRFESSPGVYREFCNTCGATVFWHCDFRPGVVDVSVGLLKSSTGARAENMLDWETGRVSFAEDAAQHDVSLIALLEKGLQNPLYSCG